MSDHYEEVRDLVERLYPPETPPPPPEPAADPTLEDLLELLSIEEFQAASDGELAKWIALVRKFNLKRHEFEVEKQALTYETRASKRETAILRLGLACVKAVRSPHEIVPDYVASHDIRDVSVVLSAVKRAINSLPDQTRKPGLAAVLDDLERTGGELVWRTPVPAEYQGNPNLKRLPHDSCEGGASAFYSEPAGAKEVLVRLRGHFEHLLSQMEQAHDLGGPHRLNRTALGIVYAANEFQVAVTGVEIRYTAGGDSKPVGQHLIEGLFEVFGVDAEAENLVERYL